MSETENMVIAPEVLAERKLENISNFDIQDLRSGSPEYLTQVLEAARKAENEVLIGVVGAFAIESARAVLAKYPGIKAYRQLDYLDIARTIFPGLEV